jgi:hypothetical protein
MPSFSSLPSFSHYNGFTIITEVYKMTSDISKFTIRIDTELLKKFRFVAEYNARSANKEIEVLMRRHIVEFEKQNGIIEDDDLLKK